MLAELALSPDSVTSGSHHVAAPRCSPCSSFAPAFVASSSVHLRIVMLITVLAGGQYFLE